MEQVQTHQTALRIRRHFTKPGLHPFDMVEWKTLALELKAPDGSITYQHDAFEVPASWEYNSALIVASKYAVLTGVPQPDGSLGGESSVKQIAYRVAHTIRQAGDENHYFASKEDADAFEAELLYLLVDQYYAFNSPVWFNTGRFHQYGLKGSPGNWAMNHATNEPFELVNDFERPQMSACFIQNVEDTIDGPQGIMELLRSEARLFKRGSGTGTNYSKIRGIGEPIKGGGKSSGLMSFLHILNANAGAVKSGGTTRRAAKMVSLDDDHPEILEFINWKRREERKAKILIQNGIGLDAKGRPDFEGEAYTTVSGQNSNNSINLSDAFLSAVERDAMWNLKRRTDGSVTKSIKARHLWNEIAEAAWECADPGAMFMGNIQKWHTCKADGPIRATNPCAEYVFMDNTSCNLGSINLLRLYDDQEGFDLEALAYITRLTTVAKDIVVQYGSFPTPHIARGTTDYRTLGLGYCNVGALLTVMGLPYDSPEGRAQVAAITAFMAATAYEQSIEMAQALGVFPRYEANRESMLSVIALHAQASAFLAASGSPIPDLLPGPQVFNHGADVIASKALEAWRRVQSNGALHGFRNAQVVVIAPTGTISYMMGAETTGIEPAFSTLTFKRLAGNAGGGIMLALNYMGRAVRNLGYSPSQTEEILKHLNSKGTIVGAPHIQVDHVPIFATAVDPAGNSLPWKSHLHMIAAIQPFLSGSVSKTINMPNSVTVKDIQDAYLLAYRLGLKNTALYRDGCKDAQPLNVANQPAAAKVVQAAAPALSKREFKVIGDKEFPDLMWGYKRPIPSDMPLSKKYRFTVGQDEINLGLSFDRDWDGKFVLVETFITVDSASAKTRSIMAVEGKRWSQLLRTGTKPSKIAKEHINVEEGVGGGMVFGHPLIKTCKTIQDLVWKHIMLHIAGQTDFIPAELLDQYMHWEERPLFVHEEMGIAAQSSGNARKERTITEFVDAPAEVVVNEDELVCPRCSASGRLAIKVSGSCKTCSACGESFGGC